MATEQVHDKVPAVMASIFTVYDEVFGRDSNKTKYFRKHGKALVVQETDVTSMQKGGAFAGYRTSAGKYGGLNEGHRDYIKRIHLLVDVEEGVYLANNLHDNYHYQVKIINLEKYLKDVASQKIELRVVGENGCGVAGENGVYSIEPPENGRPDCVVYTAKINFAISLGFNNELGGDGTSTDQAPTQNPSFMCAMGAGVSKLRPLIDQLRAIDYYKTLDKKMEAGDYGAAIRNQNKIVSHGFSFLNCTNKDREELHNLPSPQLSRSLDREAGFGNDSNMSESASKTMLGFTNLVDRMCHIFQIPTYFNDDRRNKVYAGSIIKGNRIEHMTASLVNDDSDQCNGFACHVDNQNGRKPGYSMNITYFCYIQDDAISSPEDRGHMTRLHLGGYSRYACESSLDKADNISQLLSDLEEYLGTLDEHLLHFDAARVLTPMKGDEKCQHNDEFIGRDPHANKCVFYSFYVNVLKDWINRRKAMAVLVTLPEMLEAVKTAVRWTSSPTSWAYVFGVVTSDDGVEVRVPEGVKLTDELWAKVKSKQCRTMPKVMTYESPFPLFVLYMWKSMELLGGMGVGLLKRFQPFQGLKVIDIMREEESMQNLINIIRELLRKTLARRKIFYAEELHVSGANFEDAVILKWADALSAITKECITSLSKPLSDGGVLGMGQLNSHHYVGILSCGGWIDCAHVLNTSFSRGNGTADFLLQDYGIDVKKCPQVLDIIANAPMFKDFGLHAKTVAENVTCKMGQGGDGKFYDSLSLKKGSFLCDIVGCGPVALLSNGTHMTITSGITSTHDIPHQDNPWDLRVLDKPADTALPKWLSYKGNYMRQLLKCGTFKAKNDHTQNLQKKRRARRKRKINQQIAKVHAVSWKPPSEKWGQIPKRLIKRKAARRHAHMILSRLLQRQLWKACGIGELDTDEMLKQMKDELSKETVSGLQHVENDINSIVLTLHDVESVDQLGDIQVNMKEMFRELMRKACKTGGVSTRSSKRTKLNDVESDPTYRAEAFSSTHFITAGKRMIPTFYSLRTFLPKNDIHIDVNREMSIVLKRDIGYVQKNLRFRRIDCGGWEFYNCSLITDNDHVYNSNDKIFSMSSKGRKATSFSAGTRRIHDDVVFETKVHAKIALLFVLLKQMRGDRSIEERFMEGYEYVQIVPNEHWRMNIDDPLNVKLTQGPIVCLIRSGPDIVCLDLDSLRFLDFDRDSQVLQRRSTLRNSIDGEGGELRDRFGYFLDPSTKELLPYPEKKLSYLRMKNESACADKNNKNVATYICDAKFQVHFRLPHCAQTTMVIGSGTLVGWIKVTALCGNEQSGRMVDYWYSPKIKHRVRSKAEAELFAKLCKENRGNERQVLTIFPDINMERKRAEKNAKNNNFH